MNLSNLNSEQQKAVKNICGPLLILAGAGSGKTTTMTHRIAYMIEQGIEPYSVLAVTFTNKAAGEMRDRVERLTGSTKGMWIMTFHAMCLRMLRYQSEVLGYKSGFTVYDETDKKALLKRIYKEQNIDEKNYPTAMVIGVISNCKERAEGPEEYLMNNSADFRSRTIYNIYFQYERELKSNNAMDFDDLLLNGVKLLEAAPEILEHYQNRFQYIMVDEYQDTNYLQYKLIKMLAEKNRNLCVVGDDDQCIYQWRGADIRNILDFEKDFPEAVVIKLEQNYRSDGNILGLANSVIKNNRGRKGKALWTDREEGAKVTYKRLNDDKSEAWYIGGEIDRLRSEGYKYSDMAVLYRKNAQSRSFEEKFSFRGIPYRVLAGLRFYDRKEIKDMMSYMRLVENPNDDVAILRVINEPKRGIGAKTLGAIQAYAKNYQISIYAALHEAEVRAQLPKKALAEAMQFIDMIEVCQAEKDNMSISDIYDNLIVRSGYLRALEAQNSVEADGRIENLMEFKSVISEFEKELSTGGADAYDEELAEERERLRADGFDVAEPTPLGAFLEKITLMADIDNRDEEEDAVVLMTLHSAKGLEFPIVFMPGMEAGLFPGVASMESESKLEEERRLCYVGITRAMKKLYVTSAEQRMLYGRTDYTMESQFIDEMDKDFLDGDKTASQKRRDRNAFEDDFGRDFYYNERQHGSSDGYGFAPKAKPFDQLSYAKRQVKKAVSNDDIHQGDRVEHPKFGEGLVIEESEKIITIAFESVGIKKIGKGFVNIKKL